MPQNEEDTDSLDACGVLVSLEKLHGQRPGMEMPEVHIGQQKPFNKKKIHEN